MIRDPEASCSDSRQVIKDHFGDNIGSFLRHPIVLRVHQYLILVPRHAP